MTGFVAGSLLIIWPWKREIFLRDVAGEFVMRKGEKVIGGYDWFMPSWDHTTFVAIGLIIAGVGAVWVIERMGAGTEKA